MPVRRARLAAEALEDRTTPSFAEFVDPHPAPGNQFGATVLPLSTGNVVVTSPYDDAGGTDAGAVYLFNGATGALISTLTGGQANDRIGEAGVTAVGSGNFVVRSPSWDNGSAVNAGAATWGSGTAGISGAVTAANSLVGTHASDRVGGGVVPLANGNYVVLSPDWANGSAAYAGAATWGSGTAGVRGPVTTFNSLVGGGADNQVGSGGVRALPGGNYVVLSPDWDNGSATNAGAATWGSGTAGARGFVTAVNSLVGTQAFDRVGGYFSGNDAVVVLANGNYVVNSPLWDNGSVTDAGAVTWGSGTAGVAGAVSAANSLVGTRDSDYVGSYGVTAISNGNYVVRSGAWHNGSAASAGAATWGSGTAGVKGAVSAANSLVGTRASDGVGGTVVELSDGNYAVGSPFWDNSIVTDAGAVTWGSGTAGVKGAVSAANSLVGILENEGFGSAVTPLPGGAYAVASPFWGDGVTANLGAVTRVAGGATGSFTFSAANSLIGTQAGDKVGSGGVVPLVGGDFLVLSPDWSNGAAVKAGAVTRVAGAAGPLGAVTAANSLVGTQAGDAVGSGGATVLPGGDYLVLSPGWDNGAVADAGAVTRVSRTAGPTGPVTAANSLVGAQPGDAVGAGRVVVLPNGDYLVFTPNWDNGATANAGAVTRVAASTGLTGPVTAANSLVGTQAGDVVGSDGAVVLPGGNYLVSSSLWANGAAPYAGAVTWVGAAAGPAGTVTAANSTLGQVAGTRVGYNPPPVDPVNQQYYVPAPGDVGGRVWVGSFAGGPRGVQLPVAVAPDALPEPDFNVPYTARLTATGTPGPFTFSTRGGLPDGLTLAADGTLAGTPTTPGTYTFTVAAADAAGNAGSRTYSLTVPRLLPGGRVWVAYTQTLEPPTTIPDPFGNSPYGPAQVTGQLPPGLRLDGPAGDAPVLSGAPAAAGTYRFTVTFPYLSDPRLSVSRTYTLTIAGALGPVRPVAVGGSPDGSVRVTAPGGATTLAPFGNTGTPTRTASADVDGDGTADLVAVTGPGVPIRVAVLSGKDGSVLVAPFDPFGGDFTGGGYVAAADMDADGRAEFVVTPDQGGGPRVSVFSRNPDGTLTTRANFYGIDDPNFRGGARAALGDVDRDGTPDVVVAAGFGGGPRAAIFTGASVLAGAPAKLVNDFYAFPGSDAVNLRNGAFVAAGDVDGDGHADLVFGGGPGGAPRVFILSGALISAGNFDGAYAAPVGNFYVAGNGADRGGARVAVTNSDGDGRADVAVGSGAGSPSRVRLYAGKDFAGGGEPGTHQDLDPLAGAVLADGVYVG